MADLLGSILGSMTKPPSLTDDERKKKNENKKQAEKLARQEKEALGRFRSKIRAQIQNFVKDSTQKKLKFDPMEKYQRAIVHDMAEVGGLSSFAFGEDGVNRYMMLWKKEFAPCEDELNCIRHGEEWNPEKQSQMKQEREMAAAAQLSAESCSSNQRQVPAATAARYKEKYEHIIGRQAGKSAADSTTAASRSYGLVSYENKKDVRTIEQVMADNRARKKLKTQHDSSLAQPCDVIPGPVSSTVETGHQNNNRQAPRPPPPGAGSLCAERANIAYNDNNSGVKPTIDTDQA